MGDGARTCCRRRRIGHNLCARDLRPLTTGQAERSDPSSDRYGASFSSSPRLLLARSTLSPAADSSVVFKAELVEFQGAGVLGDDAGLVVGEAVLLGGGDLDGDLQVHAVGGGQVLDDLLIQPVDVAAKALRVKADCAEEARRD